MESNEYGIIDVNLNQLKKWGIIPETNRASEYSIIFYENYKENDLVEKLMTNIWMKLSLSSMMISREQLNSQRISNLEREIKQLKKEFKEKVQTKVLIENKVFLSDIIYNENKKYLEEEYFGKYIAIDNEEKKIVGIGDSILSAYNEAKKRTGKNKFSFKRVGYIDKI